MFKYIAISHWLFPHYISERVTTDTREPSSVNSPPYLLHTCSHKGSSKHNRIVQSPENKPRVILSWFYNTVPCLLNNQLTLIRRFTISLIIAFPKRNATLNIYRFKEIFNIYTISSLVSKLKFSSKPFSHSVKKYSFESLLAIHKYE